MNGSTEVRIMNGSTDYIIFSYIMVWLHLSKGGKKIEILYKIKEQYK
jgi:hypothetical protein